jgi:acylphosphatase
MQNGENGIVRRALRFSGWVQGVGFRWRAEKAAAALGATGWVRNEPDGSVSMELQGTEAQIDGVILAVQRGTYVQVLDFTAKTIPTVEDERWFRVLD